MTVIISVFGSLAVSISSEILQYKLRWKEQKEQELETWYHKVISRSQKLRDRGLGLPYGEPVDSDTFRSGDDEVNERIAIIQEIVSELVELHAEAPPEAEQEVLTSISELDYWFDHPERVENLNTTDIRDRCSQGSESIIDEAVKESERYTEVPY